MRLVQCFCGMCRTNHTLQMTMDEFRTLMTMPGALQHDGRLCIACDNCYAFKLSKDPELQFP